MDEEQGPNGPSAPTDAGSGPNERLATLTALFTEHVDSVYNVAYRIVWNRADAEDVVQVVFLQAFVHLDDLRSPDLARPWVLRIAYHEALGVLRRRRDVPTAPDDLPLFGQQRSDSSDDPSEAVIAADLAATLGRAIGALPETLRIAFILRDVEGLPMTEVADILGVGSSAAKMRVARARETLRTTLTRSLF